MGLLPFLPLFAAAFACLGTHADAADGALPPAEWAEAIGPVHAGLAALFVIVTLRLARGAWRR